MATTDGDPAPCGDPAVTPPPDGEVEYGRMPTPAEQEIIAWAERAKTHELRHANETLRHLATMLVCFLGVSLLFWDRLPGPQATKCLATALFLAALAAGLRGWLPWTVTVQLDYMEEAMGARDRLARRKDTHLRWCCGGMLAAFVVLLAGAIFS